MMKSGLRFSDCSNFDINKPMPANTERFAEWKEIVEILSGFRSVLSEETTQLRG